MDPTASGSSAAAAGTGIDYDLLPRLLLAHDADVESEEHLDTSLRVLAPRPLAALDDIPMDGAAEGLEAQGPKKKNKSAPRTSRACLHCRKQKMRCEGSLDPPCKRCRQAGMTCTFERRSEYTLNATDSAWQTSIQRSLQVLTSTLSQVLATLEARGQGIPIDTSLFDSQQANVGDLGALMGKITGFQQYLNSDAGGGIGVDGVNGHGENGGFEDEVGKDGIQVGEYEVGVDEEVGNGVGGSGRH